MDLKSSSPSSPDTASSNNALDAPVSAAEEIARLRSSLAHAHALLAAKNELLTVREDQVRHLRAHADDLRRQLNKSQEMLERTQRFLISALRYRCDRAAPGAPSDPALLDQPPALPSAESVEQQHVLRPYEPARVPAGPAEERLKRN